MASKKPTLKFDPVWCEQIEDMGRDGLVLSNYASSLNMTVAELEALARSKKDLSAAIELAMSLALGFHTERLINPPPGSQSQLTLSFLKAHWPSIYAVENKVSSSRGSVEHDPKQSAKEMQEFFTGLHGIFYDSAKSHFAAGGSIETYLADMKDFQDRLVSGKFKVGSVYL